MRRMINGKNIQVLEKLKDNSSTNSIEVGENLSVNGTILTNYNTEALVIVDENNSSLTFSFEQNNALVIKNENATGIYLDEFNDSGELYKVATSNSLKTVFGKSIMKDTDNPQDNNIDLYVYTLKLSASFSGGMGYIYIDYQTSNNNNNVEVNSVTKFTTLTKATEGSIISCICSKESGDGVAVIGNNIRYENGMWYVYRNDSKYQYSYQGQVSNATITACSQLKKRTI